MTPAMTPTLSTPSPQSPAPLPPTLAEAARYALLRRLAPALRHEAAAHLQPITMASSVLERRLAAPAPDLPQLREGVLRLTGFSRSAVQTCLDLVGWLSPPPSARLPLGEVVAQSAALLATPLAFDGFTLLPRVAPAQASLVVEAGALRLALPACLLWLTDQAEPPLQVVVETRPLDAQRVTLQLALRPPPPPDDGLERQKAGPRREPAYRRLGWAEVMALAREEGLGLSVQGEGPGASLSLAMPLGPPADP